MTRRKRPDACQTRRGALVVDDEPVVLDVITSALTSAAEFQVIQARTAEEARSLFDTHAADLCVAIVDIRLAASNGVDFVRSLPTLIPRIPILFMTGLGDRDVADLAPEDPVLYKPFTVNTLLQAVETVVSSAPQRSAKLLD